MDDRGGMGPVSGFPIQAVKRGTWERGGARGPAPGREPRTAVPSLLHGGGGGADRGSSLRGRGDGRAPRAGYPEKVRRKWRPACGWCMVVRIRRPGVATSNGHNQTKDGSTVGRFIFLLDSSAPSSGARPACKPSPKGPPRLPARYDQGQGPRQIQLKAEVQEATGATIPEPTICPGFLGFIRFFSEKNS